VSKAKSYKNTRIGGHDKIEKMLFYVIMAAIFYTLLILDFWP